jgi:hypothetical protein
VVGWLKDLGNTVESIEQALSRHPDGIAAKYRDRLRGEIERCYGKTRRAAAGPERPPTARTIPLFWHGDRDDRAARSWLVEGVMPETGKGLLSGQWGTGKTFVAVDLAASVMTGRQFAGRLVVRTGGVLFVAAEGANEIPMRLRGVVEHNVKRRRRSMASACRSPGPKSARHSSVKGRSMF